MVQLACWHFQLPHNDAIDAGEAVASSHTVQDGDKAKEIEPQMGWLGLEGRARTCLQESPRGFTIKSQWCELSSSPNLNSVNEINTCYLLWQDIFWFIYIVQVIIKVNTDLPCNLVMLCTFDDNSSILS